MKVVELVSQTMTNQHHLFSLIIAMFIWLQAFNPAMAEDTKAIITAGPSWEHFTNKDGSGLYHDIINHIFTGYNIQHIYAPSLQANTMVANGRADIKMCETEEISPLIIAIHPMYENDFHSVYLQKRAVQWNGNLSLEGKKVVWREGYYSQADFSKPIDYTEVRSGESALKMVILERADFYIDDLNLINQSFDAIGEERNSEKFGVVKTGTRKYFPVFADTPRGEFLRKHYETEMERLYKEGVLQQIYTRWDFHIPDFKFSISDK